MSMTADDFFVGGTPSAKFESVGVTVAGIITRVGEPMQQRDFTTGEPKFWDDGRPMMQLPIDVKTDLRDPEIDSDDGTRTLYVKGEMQKAIRTAVRQAGAPGLRVGGHLSVTYTGDGEVKKRGMNPAKLYTAAYTPSAGSADRFLGGTTASASQSTAAAPQTGNGNASLEAAIAHLPLEQQAALRQVPGMTAEMVRAMYPAAS